MPKYSIVVPVYNQLEFTQRCLASLFQHSQGYDYEIVVVANGCTDDTPIYLNNWQKKDKHLVVCHYAEPLGYTEASNVGIRLSRGEYIVLLNNDTEILGPQWLQMLVDPFEKEENVGITGPLKTFSPDTGGDFMIFFCVMIPRKMFDRFGLLDTAFSPGYGEDVCFSTEVLRAGYKLIQVGGETHQEKGTNVGGFEIYHAAEATMLTLPNWNEITQRNRAELRRRYLK